MVSVGIGNFQLCWNLKGPPLCVLSVADQNIMKHWKTVYVYKSINQGQVNPFSNVEGCLWREHLSNGHVTEYGFREHITSSTTQVLNPELQKWDCRESLEKLNFEQ